MTKPRVIVAGLLLTLGLTLVPASAANSADESEMTVERAGGYYLKGACRLVPVQDNFHDKIWKGRDQVTFAEVKRRLPQIKRLSKAYGRALLKWSTHLFNPPKAWPSSVDELAFKLADQNAIHSSFRTRQGNATTAREWWRLNAKVNRMHFGNYAVKIRARLGLPPSGEGC